jgi:hypothetical protein
MSLISKCLKNLKDQVCSAFAAICVCVLIFAGLARAAEFVATGTYPIDGLSADGSTVISVRNSVAHRWTRNTGKVVIDSPANLKHYGLGNYLSADGSVFANDIISRLFNGEPDERGGVWSNEAGWQLPGPDPPVYPGSEFNALSADGSTAVGTTDPPLIPLRAIRWTSTGGIEELGVLPGQTRSVGSDVSADGAVVVGVSDVPPSHPSSSPYVGQIFRWTSATGMVAVGDLPAGYDDWRRLPRVSEDGSTIVAVAKRQGLDTYDVYRWASDTGLVPIISDMVDTRYVHISDDGSVVVTGGFDGLQYWTEQTGLQILPHLPGGYDVSAPLGASADGSVIFEYSVKAAPSTEFEVGFWTSDGSLKSLHQVFQEQGLGPSFAGWQFARSVNYFLSADGRVLAGTGINPSGANEAFVAYLDPLNVPEPTSAALGLLVLTSLATCPRGLNRSKRVLDADGVITPRPACVRRGEVKSGQGLL